MRRDRKTFMPLLKLASAVRPKLVNRTLAPAFLRMSTEASRTTQRVNTNGVDFHVERQGTGDKAIVCLCGALGTAATDFGHQLTGLSEKYSVISFDPRGYGASRPPDRDFPPNFIERDGDDAVGIMTEMGFEKFHVMGWSDGANSAAILASKYPDRVDRLIMFGGNAYITEEDMAMYEKTGDVSQWSPRMRAALDPVYGDKLQPMWTEWLEAMRTMYREGGGDVCTHTLSDIRAKTLVLHGRKDPMVPEFHADYLHERVHHSRLHVFQEGKHNPHIRFADEFNQLVADFLEEPDDKEAQSREHAAVPGGAGTTTPRGCL